MRALVQLRASLRCPKGVMAEIQDEVGKVRESALKGEAGESSDGNSYEYFTHRHTDELPVAVIRAGDRIALKPKDSKYTGGVIKSRYRDGMKEMAVVLMDLDKREKTIELIPYYARHVYRLRERRIPCVLVCGETVDFRACARLQVLPSDFCVEIGSSYGDTSVLLARYCRRTIGFDCSKECVEEARRRHPALSFIAADCFLHDGLVREQSLGADVVFVDIGGDRCIPDQLEMLAWVQANLQPACIVIKSRKMHCQMREYASSLGLEGSGQALPEMTAWIALQRSAGPGDADASGIPIPTRVKHRTSRSGKRKRAQELQEKAGNLD